MACHKLSYDRADINDIGYGETPLYMASSWGRFYIVELLLSRGAKIAVENVSQLKRTPI